MKNYIFKLTTLHALLMLAMTLALVNCADRFPSCYTLELPELPQSWISILGQPHWRLEWVDPGGQRQIKDFPPGGFSGIEIEIPVTWTNPITAWPYWPSHNLPPNIFKPCGALFPFDVSNSNKSSNHIILSWEAGPNVIFYWELAHASNRKESIDTIKIPANFDWLRFRELFRSNVLSEAVIKDPWLVNWSNLAERTIESNFDRRRIVSEAADPRHFPVPAGTWYGVSPFAEPLIFTEDMQTVFPVRSGLNVWVFEEGILRVNGNTWVFSKIINKK